MNNCGQACLSVTVIDRYKVSGGLDNLRFFFVFCLRIGVTQGHCLAVRFQTAC